MRALMLLLVVSVLLLACTQQSMLPYVGEGFTLAYPQGWKVSEQSPFEVALLAPQSADTFTPNIVVLVQDLSAEPVTLEEYVASSDQQLAQLVADYAPVDSRESILAGLPAHTWVYEGGVETRLRISQRVAIRDETAYILTYARTIEQAEDEPVDFARVADSFAFSSS